MSLIISNLYLGGEVDSRNPQLVQNATVINVAAEISKTPYAEKYIYIPCDDNNFNIKQYFNQTFSIIDRELKAGKNVLVHCYAGVSRSATIVIAYLMRKYRWSMFKAINFVRSRRLIINPNIYFVYQLQEYQMELGL
jgi:protein-tyrosine phosphatase